MITRNRLTLLWAAAVLAAGMAAARPQVSDVRMVAQQNSRKVDVYYRLTGGDAYVTLGIETNAATAPAWSGVRIPDRHVASLSGDVSGLVTADANNDKHIVWDARADWPDQKIDEARAVVEV
ncbi:MAG: hypothetical protein PHU80_07615, partial [Kiritimatiellae bacterium]|nr:hypothetical protein [Kiritimatiellia bacterium]